MRNPSPDDRRSRRMGIPREPDGERSTKMWGLGPGAGSARLGAKPGLARLAAAGTISTHSD